MTKITAETLRTSSRALIDEVVAEVCADPKKFRQLWSLATGDDDGRIRMRAAWAMDHAAKIEPGLAMPYRQRIIAHLPEAKVDGVRRGFLHILTRIPIQPSQAGALLDLALGHLADPGEAKAIRFYSLQICEQLACGDPDLSRELALVLEETMRHETGWFRKRCRMTRDALGWADRPEDW